jgi:hypothetical protein
MGPLQLQPCKSPFEVHRLILFPLHAELIQSGFLSSGQPWLGLQKPNKSRLVSCVGIGNGCTYSFSRVPLCRRARIRSPGTWDGHT